MAIVRAQRIYFLVVGLFAIWVGVWAYGIPALVDHALPWMVPPLHSRLIGAMYLSGAALMFGSLFARADANFIALVVAAVWTGMLGIVSFLHLSEFDFSRSPVWFWFFAYVTFPIAGAVLAWMAGSPHSTGRALHHWLRAGTAAIGTVCIVLAVCLFFATDTMVEIWPWQITPLLAQIYSGPFLAYGVGALLVARSQLAHEVQWSLIAMASFAVLVLAASLTHRAVLEPIGVAAIIWFAGLVLATVLLVTAAVRVVR